MLWKIRLRWVSFPAALLLAVSGLAWIGGSAVSVRGQEAAQDQQPSALPGVSQEGSTGEVEEVPPATYVEPSPPPEAGTSEAEEQVRELIDFSFDHASLDTVLEVLFREGGYIFLKEGTSVGDITVLNMQKLTLEEALNVLVSVLRAKGYTLQLTANDKIYRIIPLGDALSSTGPVRVSVQIPGKGIDPEQIPDTDELVTQVIQLRYAIASKLVKELGNLVAKDYANLTSNDDSNTLIITDASSNVRRIASIIKELDVPSIPVAEVKVIRLEKADAREVADVLNKLFVTTTTRGTSRSSTAQRVMGMMRMRGMGREPTSSEATRQPQATTRQLVRITSDDRTNSVIVAAPAELMPTIEELIKELDGEEDVGEMRDVRVYLLQSAEASEVMTAVNAVFTPSRQEQSARRRIGFVRVMEGAGTGSGTRAMLKETVRVSVNERLNALIVVATPENLALVDKLVTELDRPVEEHKTRVIRVENLDPRTLAELLEKLKTAPKGRGSTTPATRAAPGRSTPSQRGFRGGGRRGSRGSFNPGGSSSNDGGGQISGQDRLALAASIPSGGMGGSSLLPGLILANYEAESEQNQPEPDTRAIYDLSEDVTVTYDEATGSIIVIGPEDALDAAEELIYKLDAQPALGQATFIAHLNNANAAELAGVLSQLFGTATTTRRTTTTRPSLARPTTSTRRTTTRSGSRGSGGSSFGGGPGRSDSSGPVDNLQQVAAATDGGFVPIAVTTGIEGEVVIIPDENTNSLLIRTDPRNVEQLQQIIAELDKAPAQVLIQVLLAEREVDKSKELGVEFTNYDLDRAAGGSDAILGYQFGLPRPAEGLSYSLVSDNVEAYLVALEREGKLNILSRPQILVADNKEASIVSGGRVPFITTSRVTPEGSIINSISYEEVGIMLSVIPHINPEGFVNMEISPEISTVGESTIPISEFVNATTFPTRNAYTTVSIRDGQTILIGGLIADTTDERIEKVPILGSLPLIGFLFRHKENTSVKTELLIVLTPRVVRSAEELQELSSQERARSRIEPHPDFEQLRRGDPFLVEPLPESDEVKPMPD